MIKRRTSDPVRYLLLTVLLLFTAIPTLPAQEAPGTWEEALRWLDQNRSSPQFGNVVLMAASLAPSLSDLETLVSENLADVVDRRTRAEILHRTGRVFETGNRFSRASYWYEQAIDTDPAHVEAMRDHAAVLLEIGEADEAIKLLTRVINNAADLSLQRSAAILRARAFLLSGNAERAVTHARSLVGTNTEPETLFLLFEIARTLGDSRLEEEALRRLEGEFSGTPERALSADDGVAHVPVPTRILGDATLPVPSAAPFVELPEQDDPAPAPETPVRTAEETPPPVDHAPLTGIQTGSFRDPENAQYMARDIRDRGFEARITSTERETGTFYRVIIPVERGTSVAEAQNLIVQLKEQGIEGFLVFDQ